ncbi:MAG TPA: amidohydrolase [Erysipelotrichaceae bacterium]|nr:amidohydrolase [Erysipelotrichaceae bacterium]
MILELLKKIDEYKDEMIQIRRHLHQYPELSFEEHQTKKYILDFYRDKDCQIVNNSKITGFFVKISGKNPGPTVALRADFDAIPVQEETDLPFKSKNAGVSHGCGHDGHTAYLMILAKVLIEFKDQLNGNIIIIHQHAEEKPPGGALEMIAAGCLADVDNFFSLHLISTMPYAKVFFNAKETQAARATFKVELVGRGSHGSEPHNGNDAILAASHLIIAIQSIVSRKVKPGEMAVVTIGSFDGKGSPNVIKEKVLLEGDVRCMKDEVAALIEEQFRQIAEGVAETFGVGLKIEYNQDYPVLYNDPEMTELAMQGVKDIQKHAPEIKEVAITSPLSASEDASHYLRKIPGTYFYVGAGQIDKETYPHHNPKFDLNEGALVIAAKAMIGVLARYFNWK